MKKDWKGYRRAFECDGGCEYVNIVIDCVRVGVGEGVSEMKGHDSGGRKKEGRKKKRHDQLEGTHKAR